MAEIIRTTICLVVDGKVVTRETREVIVHETNRHPRAEVRDSETGEVIFPAVKGPLSVVQGGKSDSDHG